MDAAWSRYLPSAATFAISATAQLHTVADTALVMSRPVGRPGFERLLRAAGPVDLVNGSETEAQTTPLIHTQRCTATTLPWSYQQ